MHRRLALTVFWTVFYNGRGFDGFASTATRAAFEPPRSDNDARERETMEVRGTRIGARVPRARRSARQAQRVGRAAGVASTREHRRVMSRG